MSLTALPNDCLLACLARVPYADLRNGIPCTCKSLCDAVASSAFRKTREAAGYVEWAGFTIDWRNNAAAPYLIQASGAYRVAPGPQLGQDWHLARLSSGRGDEIVILQTYPEMRAVAFHPLQNRWRELATPSRDSEWFGGDGIGEWVTCCGLGSTIMLIGGDVVPRMPIDVYDASQDTWSRRPDFPFCEPGECYSKAIEVDGKLWLYALDDHLQETFVYDPATQTWAAGPRLPHELYDEGGVHWHYQAFEWRKRFCLMACCKLAPEDVARPYNVRYLAFIWDPLREAWDEAPFPVPPVLALIGESIDNHLVVVGHVDSSDPTGRISTRRLFVLRPDSRVWDEWRVPDEVRDSGIYVTAVRLG
ncbi:unnamed protein product [Pelagomonas calceolata]|uniref:F-box domain-containing protein n=1 Tax=Pelagomonas calceolata TaxID=35677 RepID=A0A8J2T2J8_9STRA|nr:unnamed protein product [Pelagomonas calceolata]